MEKFREKIASLEKEKAMAQLQKRFGVELLELIDTCRGDAAGFIRSILTKYCPSPDLVDTPKG